MSESHDNARRLPAEEGRKPLVPYLFDDGDEYELYFLPPERAEANRAADAAIEQQFQNLLEAILSGETPSLLSEGRRSSVEPEEPPSA